MHSVLQLLHLAVGSFTILIALPRTSRVTAILKGTGTWWGFGLNSLLNTMQVGARAASAG